MTGRPEYRDISCSVRSARISASARFTRQASVVELGGRQRARVETPGCSMVTVSRVPDPSLGLVLLLGAAVLVGALVQGSVGFGIVVVAAPFVVWAAPELMPGSMLVCGFVMPLLQLWTRWQDIDWVSLRAALTGRLLLTPVGVWVVAVSSTRLIALLVGVLVLAVALATAYAPAFEPRPRNLFLAGTVTGVSGTAAAVGGPFVAMTLQHDEPARIRATLAAFFAVGSFVSLVGLSVAGELTREQLWWGAVLVPFLAVGYLLSGPVVRRLDAGLLRTAMLWFCVVASVSVIVRAALA
jgi:uncharacterized membrane protein YfcA